MKHNKELSITIGGSRKETNWKPQRIMWQEFVERLRTPVESEETQEEYKRLTKAQQDDLKAWADSWAVCSTAHEERAAA